MRVQRLYSRNSVRTMGNRSDPFTLIDGDSIQSHMDVDHMLSEALGWQAFEDLLDHESYVTEDVSLDLRDLSKASS